MHGPVDAFPYGEGLLQQIGCIVKSVLVQQGSPESIQAGRGNGAVLTVIRLVNVERLAKKLLRFGVIPQVLLDAAEVAEIVRDQRMAVAIELPVHVEHAAV